MNSTPSGLVVGTQPKKLSGPQAYAVGHVCLIGIFFLSRDFRFSNLCPVGRLISLLL